MASAGSVTVDFDARSARFAAELEMVQGILKRLEGSASSLAKGLKLIPALFAAEAAGRVLGYAKAMFEAADAIGDVAARSGIAVESLISSEVHRRAVGRRVQLADDRHQAVPKEPVRRDERFVVRRTIVRAGRRSVGAISESGAGRAPASRQGSRSAWHCARGADGRRDRRGRSGLEEAARDRRQLPAERPRPTRSVHRRHRRALREISDEVAVLTERLRVLNAKESLSTISGKRAQGRPGGGSW